MPVLESASLTDNGSPDMEPALYSYEYVITLDQEIKYIWTKKWGLPTLIFALNRYVNFAFTRTGRLSPSTYAVRTILLIFFVLMTYIFVEAGFLCWSNAYHMLTNSILAASGPSGSKAYYF